MPEVVSWKVSQVLLRADLCRANLQIHGGDARGPPSCLEVWIRSSVLYYSSWFWSHGRIYLWWGSESHTSENCMGVWLGVRLTKLPCAACYIKRSRPWLARWVCKWGVEFYQSAESCQTWKGVGSHKSRKRVPNLVCGSGSLSLSVNGVIRKHRATFSTMVNAHLIVPAWIETLPGCLDVLLAFACISAALISAWSCPTALF